MKKISSFFAVGVLAVTLGMFSFGLNTQTVQAKTLPYKTWYHQNIFTGAKSNFQYQSINVASNKYVRYSTNTIVGQNGWNYNRWLTFFVIY